MAYRAGKEVQLPLQTTGQPLSTQQPIKGHGHSRAQDSTNEDVDRETAKQPSRKGVRSPRGGGRGQTIYAGGDDGQASVD